ncbi:MAG TPA: carboxypeptidase regulatory-like domain-containing protein [Candidatus Acidoferrales bacterium]|nr:carboxypeptidase regulatory-like domain-containing protein [Candidatus Acidoferrales bacterium]
MRTAEVCACVLALSVFAVSAVAVPRKAGGFPQARTAKAPTAPATTARAQAEPSESAKESSTKLPVRRVILYKTGVGYFEHEGEVRGDQTVGIDFTSGQLNDVLQSLTVLDLGGGRITGVNYNSEAPLSQRLGMLRLPLTEQTNISKFYGALRGARLEVRSGSNAITGRLLSVERKKRVSGGTTLEVDVITLVSDAGDVRSVELTPGVTVRLAERDVNEEVGHYLGLLASLRQEDLRRMTIATSGTGERQLFVSYISEVPVWKTTYRIILPSKADEEPLLQGWAIVDNTVGEDWNNVELSLVAGAPQSFIQQLSQPYYTRRPVVPLPEIAQLTPQTHESAMLGGLGSVAGTITDPSGAAVANAQVRLFDSAGNLIGSQTSDGKGHYEFDDLPAAMYRLEVTMNGFQRAMVNGLSLGGGNEVTQDVSMQVGSVSETVMVAAAAPMPATESLEVMTRKTQIGSGRELGIAGDKPGGSAGGVAGGIIGRFGSGFGGGVGGGAGAGRGRDAFLKLMNHMPAAATGQELGDLFEYKLKDRVTIHKNESALVPIVQTHVKAEKVSIWNASSGTPAPLRASWLTNSSSLTLDGGSFSIIEDDAFAGEGLTNPIKPGEKRLISYAADLGVRVQSQADTMPEHVTRVHIAHGVMIQTSEYRQQTTYTIRDDDTTPRTVLIEHPVRAGWVISKDGPQPEETTSSVYRFRVKADPKSKATLELNESRPIESRYELTNLTDDQITLFSRQRSINPAVEDALRKIVDQKNRIAALDAQIATRAGETQKIYDDQQRIRENLKALKGSAEERALTERYTKQLSDQETRLETLQKESAAFQGQRDQAQAELDKMIEGLTLDTTI